MAPQTDLCLHAEGPPEDGEASSVGHSIDWGDGSTSYDEGTELEYDYEDDPELDQESFHVCR